MKKCPYCAEEIQDEAIKCKHCMEFLDASMRPLPPPVPVVPEASLPWYFKTSFIVLMFLSLPPLALPSVWMHPKWHVLLKLGITAAVIAFCWVAVYAIQGIFDYYLQTIKTINELKF